MLTSKCKPATCRELLAPEDEQCHVRFAPESGHTAVRRECLLSAISGHRQPHSITSSARESSDGGTVRPSIRALAFRLNGLLALGCGSNRKCKRA
jgi:hypothetical protein